MMMKGKVLDMMPSFKSVETATVDGDEYKKYIGDLAMGEKKAKGVLYVKCVRTSIAYTFSLFYF